MSRETLFFFLLIGIKGAIWKPNIIGKYRLSEYGGPRRSKKCGTVRDRKEAGATLVSVCMNFAFPFSCLLEGGPKKESSHRYFSSQD